MLSLSFALLLLVTMQESAAYSVTKANGVFANPLQCSDVLDANPSSGDGVYKVQLKGVLTDVLCDMTTLDGGWTVVQQRMFYNADFNVNWTDYKIGFGTVDQSHDFWLGNDRLHWLTMRLGVDQSLRIELMPCSSADYCNINANLRPQSITYNGAKIKDETESYRLTINSLESTCKLHDDLNIVVDYVHPGSPFLTQDRQGISDLSNLGKYPSFIGSGGWWFGAHANIAPLGDVNAVISPNCTGPLVTDENQLRVAWSSHQSGTLFPKSTQIKLRPIGWKRKKPYYKDLSGTDFGNLH